MPVNRSHLPFLKLITCFYVACAGSTAFAAGDSNEASDAYLLSLNPQVFYDFDTPTGQTTDLNDGVGNSSAITLSGGTSTAGNRVGLDGTDDFGSFTGLGADLDGASAITVMFTQNFVQGGATGNRWLFSEANGAGQPLTIRGDRDFAAIEGRSTAGDSFQSSGATSPAANDFGLHHRAFVFDYTNGTAKHYVDGNLVKTETGLTFNSNTLNGSIFGTNIFVGSNSGTSDFQDATIDQFAIFDRELTATEINTIATIIPEPGSTSVLMLGLTGLLTRRKGQG
jgi:hypothetical protein